MPAVGTKAPLDITTTFTRVGAPVDIAPPDPADTMSYEDLRRSLVDD